MYDVSFDNENNVELKNKKIMYLLIKRAFDIVMSGIAMLVLSPIFLIIAVLVKVDSKGPVFFGHKRLGQGGKIIKVYKFRTMVQNAEAMLDTLPEDKLEEFKENFKLDDDPRITKVGSVLRESSLDELPQLLNIFLGNMTIVGPRPIIVKELEKYHEFGTKLLSVKPGLTGNWQANGRSETTYEERVDMDMEYIDKRGLVFDLVIIFKTFGAVFRKRGAK